MDSTYAKVCLKWRTPVARSAGGAPSSGPGPRAITAAAILELALLGSLFAAWYISNIVFNIYNKQTLQAFPYPLTITTLQLIIGAAIAMLLWATRIVKPPRVSMNLIKGMLPLAIIHCSGNLLTNMSLGSVAVSFTHTIKAMEPFFTVVLSSLFLGEHPTLGVLLTLLPIVGGVAIASMSELSFNWMGFMTAMGSNLTFQSRNVLSKKLMMSPKEMGQDLDNMSMFSVITVLSLFILLPFQLAMEGWAYAPGALEAAGVALPGLFWQQIFFASVCRSADQQVSYMILQRVSPVTHSIGNCVKRCVVIVAAILFFHNPVTTQNGVGTCLALFGVFAYTQVKRLQREAAEDSVEVGELNQSISDLELKEEPEQKRRSRPDETLDELPPG